MKKINILPTSESRLYFNKNENRFQLCKVVKPSTSLKPTYNIYITSDDEIKIDEYYLSDGVIYNLCSTANGNNPKKIILTNDQFLIDDGIQELPIEFLNWYVLDPWDYVDVKHCLVSPMGKIVDPMNLGQNHSSCVWKHMITFPNLEYLNRIGLTPYKPMVDDVIIKELEFIHDSVRNMDFDLGFKTGMLTGVRYQEKKQHNDKSKCVTEMTMEEIYDKCLNTHKIPKEKFGNEITETKSNRDLIMKLVSTWKNRQIYYENLAEKI